MKCDPLKDIPVGWAARMLILTKLCRWTKEEREAAFEIWQREKARTDTAGPAEKMLAVYRRRLLGDRELGPMYVYFNELTSTLSFDDAAGRRFSVNCTEGGPNARANEHECASTAAWTLLSVATEDGVEWVAGWDPQTPSLLNKAVMGHRGALRALGIAVIARYDLPVAHVDEEWSIDPLTRVIVATVPFTMPAVAEVPAVEFFLRLYRNGRLPLSTENDVLLLVACIAAPLLRHVGVGQLGVFWFVGPPGSGKDYLAELVTMIWEEVGKFGVRAKFDLNLAGDLETKRSFDMAQGAVFARAKEAGKRIGLVEELIRLSGTDVVSARGLHRNERNIPNVFVYVADSAEDVPDRREISRRTTMISVAEMDDQISKGAVLDEVRQAAPGLLLHLKKLIESKPADWYRHQADTGTRPLIPVALARLLGATLPEVSGQDLSEMFEAMREFVDTNNGKEEGEQERKKAVQRDDKEGKEAKALPSYRLTYFIDQMRGMTGYRELFATWGDKQRAVTTRIMRESSYSDVRAGRRPYLAVDINGKSYAFKLLRGNRNFTLLLEDDFKNRLANIECGTPPATTVDESNDSRKHGPVAPPGTIPAVANPGSDATFVFTDDELLKNGGSGSP
ncbi:MAG TPA: hypothetical protein VK550_00725 [Polyangiaceae bacterium]|nr:hypothetical protein [Polyangiaceae bacterium]